MFTAGKGDTGWSCCVKEINCLDINDRYGINGYKFFNSESS